MSEAGRNDFVVLGQIGAAYGIKGWVKIHSQTEPREGILAYENWYIRLQGDPWQPVRLVDSKRQAKGLIARLEGCDDRNAAERLRNAEIGVPFSQLPELEPGEYYWHQLEQLRVFTETASGAEVLLGKVSHLLATGSNDVLVVRACENSLDKRERLVPFLMDQVVKRIDLETGCMWVDWDPEF